MCVVGSTLLVLTATEVSADSYYGEQGLHFVSTEGDSCLVPRSKYIKLKHWPGLVQINILKSCLYRH